MTMRTFTTEAEFTGAVSDALSPGKLPPEVRAALTAGIGAAEADSRDGAVVEDGAFNLRISDWVLREQDLPVAETIAVVGAAAAGLLAPGVVIAGAVVTALSAFAALAWKVWRKGAKLSKAEIAVLGLLEVHGPMTGEALQAKAAAALPDISPSAVAAALTTLRDVELRDGDLVELIRQDAAGQWRARA